MKNYYIVNSTIFDNEEDLVNALKRGEVVVNDDAHLKFKIEDYTRKKGEPRRSKDLLISSVFNNDWGKVWVDWSSPKSVVNTMDYWTEGDIHRRFVDWRRHND